MSLIAVLDYGLARSNHGLFNRFTLLNYALFDFRDETGPLRAGCEVFSRSGNQNSLRLPFPISKELVQFNDQLRFALKYFLSVRFHDLRIDVRDDCDEEIQEDNRVHEHEKEPRKPNKNLRNVG